MDEPTNDEPTSGTETGSPDVPVPDAQAVATYFPHGNGARNYHLTGKWTTETKEIPKKPHDYLTPFDRAINGKNIPAETVRDTPPYGWINHNSLFSRLSQARISVAPPEGKSFVRRVFFGTEKNRERALAFFMAALEHDFSFTTNDGESVKFSDACCYAHNKKKAGAIELFFDPDFVDSFKHLLAHKGVYGKDLVSMLEFLVTSGISGDSKHAHTLAASIIALSDDYPNVSKAATVSLPEGVNGTPIALNATWMDEFFNDGLKKVSRDVFSRR